jgi:hypothetical protein
MFVTAMPIEIPARKAAINAKTSFSVALTTFLSSPGVGGAVFFFRGCPLNLVTLYHDAVILSSTFY